MYLSGGTRVSRCRCTLTSFTRMGEFQALIPKKLQTKFGAKTIRTVFMDYDFSSMCYIVAALPHMALKQTAHGVFNDELSPS